MAGSSSSPAERSPKKPGNDVKLSPLAALLACACALVALGCEPSDPSGDNATAEVVTSTNAGETSTSTTEGSQSMPGHAPPARRPRLLRVAKVTDGDTIDLDNGRTIRLVQIDAPEASGECYGRKSGTVLRRMLPVGARVRVERDPALDDIDRYGRLLRYVFKGRQNVNVDLVRKGAASIWFYDGDQGRYADQLLRAAENARAAKRGAWGACQAALDATAAFSTQPKQNRPRAQSLVPTGSCDPSYPDVCIPPYDDVGDLDCGDVPRGPFAVRPPDPHAFDGNGDDVGCETG
jgi:endonuclease YncB( thermonuclease family)